MPKKLTGTSVYDTYKGVIHAFGQPLPVSGQVRLNDGVGNDLSLAIGQNSNGVTVYGAITATSIFLPNNDVTPGSTNNPIQIGSTTGTNLVIDGNEIMARNNGAVSVLYLNSEGGTLNIGQPLSATNTYIYGNCIVSSGVTAGSFSSTSSLQLKTNVTRLDNALDIVKKLRGVRYDWKSTGFADVGMIAEEVNEVLPELVKKDSSGNPEAIEYGKLVSVLIEAVKELSEKIK